jgi:antitoxin component YwqK of YwqJK toxin-antitoxin module
MKPYIGIAVFFIYFLPLHSQSVLETWPNGYPKTEGTYVDGKKNGAFTEYYETGGIQSLILLTKKQVPGKVISPPAPLKMW